jgi:hypothetical protein
LFCSELTSALLEACLPSFLAVLAPLARQNTRHQNTARPPYGAETFVDSTESDVATLDEGESSASEKLQL